MKGTHNLLLKNERINSIHAAIAHIKMNLRARTGRGRSDVKRVRKLNKHIIVLAAQLKKLYAE
jgi:hypothetical protein